MENNSIELLGITMGTITIFSGFIFTFEDSPISLIHDMTSFTILILNIYFIIKWLYLFARALNWKNEKYHKFLRIYAFFLCTKYQGTFKSTMTEISNFQKE